MCVYYIALVTTICLFQWVKSLYGKVKSLFLSVYREVTREREREREILQAEDYCLKILAINQVCPPSHKEFCSSEERYISHSHLKIFFA